MLSLLAWPLAAMAGGVVGAIAHEATHALVATAVGTWHGVTWRGGVATGGPVVLFETADRWRSELVRKAPLVVGVGVALGVAAADGVTLARVGAAGVATGLLWTSPADLFRSRARVEP